MGRCVMIQSKSHIGTYIRINRSRNDHIRKKFGCLVTEPELQFGGGRGLANERRTRNDSGYLLQGLRGCWRGHGKAKDFASALN